MAIDTAPAATTNHTAGTSAGIVHYEIGAKDSAKLVAFYGRVFGWQFQGGPGMEDYKMAQAGDTGIAIYTSDEGCKLTNYIGVDSVTTYVEKITAAGGTVAHQFTVPYMGYGAVALDPEGNPIGVWQQDSTARE